MLETLAIIVASLNPETAGVAKVLIEKVSETVGSLALPWQIKRVAEAKAEASVIEAKGEAKSKVILAEADAEVQALLDGVIKERARYQQNLRNIVAKSIPELKASANPSAIENDWMANFFEKCRNVSNEEMQRLWGKVLAGEANAPGSFTKRTVNFISELDKKDADAFSLLCSFGLGSGNEMPIILNDVAPIYSSNGLTYSVLLHLESIGLIALKQLNNFSMDYKGNSVMFAYFGRRMGLQLPQKRIDNIGIVFLTPMGKELAPIAGGARIEGFFEYILKLWEGYSAREIP